ncbi:MAG: hypothetical protein GY929_16255, partial [Actinomycetia bacterium]|nr:hypothetical protein [Actinomycetes bacterium]
TLFGSGAVEQFDSAGTSLGAFVSSGLTQAHTPRFGPDGDLWVSDYWNEEIRRFDGSTGAALGARITESPPAGPYGFTFVPNLQVRVTSGLVVNSSGDSTDASAGDGVCDTGGLNAAAQTECTLRAAIEEANASSGSDAITFDIPTADGGHSAGVWTITPTSALPSISDPITIDGTSQSGASAATSVSPAAIDSSLAIELSGTAMPGAEMALQLVAGSSGSEIRGLAISGFDGGTTAYAIGVQASSDNVIAGNHLGVSASGATEGANYIGVRIEGASTGNRIGGSLAADRNLFTAHDYAHIDIGGAGATGTTIQGNDFGLLGGGADAVGATPTGITVWNGSSGTLIGGSDPAAGNR